MFGESEIYNNYSCSGRKIYFCGPVLLKPFLSVKLWINWIFLFLQGMEYRNLNALVIHYSLLGFSALFVYEMSLSYIRNPVP